MECNEKPDTSVRSDDYLLNAYLEELEACLEKKKLRYVRQQERLERLQQTLNYTTFLFVLPRCTMNCATGFIATSITDIFVWPFICATG